jgi:hypothetical protein
MGRTEFGWLRIRSSGEFVMKTVMNLGGFHEESWLLFDNLSNNFSQNILHNGVSQSVSQF